MGLQVWYGIYSQSKARAPLWKGVNVNQVAQTVPGNEGPRKMQKNRKIGVEKQTATKERGKEKKQMAIFDKETRQIRYGMVFINNQRAALWKGESYPYPSS